MAKIQFGMMMTDARGKLGGQVFSKNRAGSYVRTKKTPSNPRTLDQQANRSLLGSTSRGWSHLTTDQRILWNEAVINWQRKNVFGATHIPSGKSLYVQLNKVLLANGASMIDVPPAKIDIPVFGLKSSLITIGDGTLSLGYGGDATGFNIQLRATPMLTAGTSNAKNRFRIIGYFNGASYSATDGYDAYVAKFGVPTAGANIQIEVSLVAESGQISVPEKVTAGVTA